MANTPTIDIPVSGIQGAMDLPSETHRSYNSRFFRDQLAGDLLVAMTRNLASPNYQTCARKEALDCGMSLAEFLGGQAVHSANKLLEILEMDTTK